MGRVDVEVRKGSIGCDVWVVGVSWARREMMFRGSFRNSFLGHSSSHSVLVRPVNSWGALGLEMDGTRFFFHQNGVELRLSVTTPYYTKLKRLHNVVLCH
jgi:hypothetical protein